MSWTAFDLSKALRRCRDVAIKYRWEVPTPGPDCAYFLKGDGSGPDDHWVVVFISINGGIRLVKTDQGHYLGKARASWAANYLRTH